MSDHNSDKIDENCNDVPLTATIEVYPLGLRLSREIMVPLSYHHLKAAYYFAKSSYEIEQSGHAKDFDINQSYAIGCIITSVSYLEAKINEYFSRTFKEMWKVQETQNILNKYKVYLLCAKKFPFVDLVSNYNLPSL